MTERMFFNPVKKISKNKTLELQSGTWHYWQYFDFTVRWNRHTDHAGFNFRIELFGLYFMIDIYDGRHWDWENDCWEKYEENKFDDSYTAPAGYNALSQFKSPGVYTIEKGN